MNTGDEDKQLILKLKTGNKEAFNLIFKKYKDKILYFALKLSKSKVEAEGILQETFLRLWKNKNSLKEGYSLDAYLFAIARNLVMDYFKRKSHTELVNRYLSSVINDLEYNGQETMILEEFDKEIKKHINELPEKRRIIFILSRKIGLTHREIAEYLFISENTVKNQIQLALNHLKSKIGVLFIILIITVIHFIF